MDFNLELVREGLGLMVDVKARKYQVCRIVPVHFVVVVSFRFTRFVRNRVDPVVFPQNSPAIGADDTWVFAHFPRRERVTLAAYYERTRRSNLIPTTGGCRCYSRDPWELGFTMDR